MKKLAKKSRKSLVLKRETLQRLNTSGAYNFKATDFCKELPPFFGGFWSIPLGACVGALTAFTDHPGNPLP